MANSPAGSVPVQFASKRPNDAFPGVDDVEPTDLWAQRATVAIIDVRRPDEFTGELGHVPGSTLVTLDTLPDRLSEIPKDRTVVFVCRSGQRSARAVQYAKEHGFTDVYNMGGGMLRWNELSLSTENGNA